MLFFHSMPKRELSRSLKSESGVDRNLLRTCIITIKLEQLDAPKPHKSLIKTEHLQRSVRQNASQLEVSWPDATERTSVLLHRLLSLKCCTGSSLSPTEKNRLPPLPPNPTKAPLSCKFKRQYWTNIFNSNISWFKKYLQIPWNLQKNLAISNNP